MPELDMTLRVVLGWEGDDDSAVVWAQENGSAIQEEALTETEGPIARAFESLVELADWSGDVAAWGLANLFRTARDASAHLLHKFVSFAGAAARHTRSLFQPLSILFHRYASLLVQLARKLHATGYSIGVNIPFGFSFALNFDLPLAASWLPAATPITLAKDALPAGRVRTQKKSRSGFKASSAGLQRPLPVKGPLRFKPTTPEPPSLTP